MTSSWNKETAAAGETIPIYSIDTLQTFVGDINKNFFSMSDDTNLESVYLSTFANDTVMPI